MNNSLTNGRSINAMFYGDSITQGWNNQGSATFKALFEPHGVVNYGIPGDRTEHILWRVQSDEVTRKMNPVMCVINIGTNNIGLGNPVPDIALGITFNVLELRKRLPQMKILLLGILPRNNEGMTRIGQSVNQIIKLLDNGETVRYLDMSEQFYSGNGQFVTELYTSDLIHLSEAGYRKWASVMSPLVNEMLGFSSASRVATLPLLMGILLIRSFMWWWQSSRLS